jgi:stage II sporulation protein P
MDLSLVEFGNAYINNATGLKPDTETLLTLPLKDSVSVASVYSSRDPLVLIVHTHGTEAYSVDGAISFKDDGAEIARSRDTGKNVVAVGEVLANELNDHGVPTLHCKVMHDEFQYKDAYSRSEETIRKYLKEYPSIRLILDLHRDAMEDGTGKQLCTTVDVKGQKSSQLMMVVGSSAGGLHHPAWQENMALALKLHVQLEKLYPGICRPVSFRYQRFNQDLSPGAMLIEVGTAGNTLPQALVAAQCLADAIIALSMGANC